MTRLDHLRFEILNSGKIILVVTVVLAMGAGVVAGRLSGRWHEQAMSEHPASGPHQPDGPGRQPSWLADQLNLTPEQRQQMDAIWAENKPKIEKTMEKQQALDHERDEAIADLLGPAQWAAYGKLIDEFRAKRSDIEQERAGLFHDANTRSRAMLDDAQKKTWDELSKNPRERRRPRGPASQRSTTIPE